MKHVSFIRGINVGKAKRVAMVELRTLAGELGYTNVRTLRNSGNLIFDTTRVKGKTASKKIEKELYSRLNVAARVITLTEGEIDRIIGANPLGEIATEPSRFLIAILEDPDDRSLLQPILEQDWTPEIIALDERGVYLWCPGGVLASPLAKAVYGALGEKVSTRNWATMLKIDQMIKKK
jgi:uncharacterized protein (DUF1697 family)